MAGKSGGRRPRARTEAFRGIRRVLVPFDFSEPAKPLLDHAMELMRARGARVRLLHVVDPVWLPPLALAFAPAVGTGPATAGDTTAAAERRLREIAASRPGLLYEIAVRTGEPAAVILDEARDWEADAIVLGSHGRTGLDRVLLGSVAEQVVRRARCAVLMVPRGELPPEPAR
jgi:nucleotide-binding universal stress UspA family protein